MTNREQFLLDRKNSIGGSDSAAVFGMSPYNTPLSLYMDKIGLYAENITPKKEAVFGRGHVLEKLLRALFERNYGLKIDEALQAEHREYSFIRGHVDGIVKRDNAIVEFKTSALNSKDEWGDELTDEIPRHYLLQVHHYLLIHETCEKVYVPVFRGNNDMLQILANLVKKYGVDFNLLDDVDINFKLYVVQKGELHAKLSQRMIEEYKKFWNEHVIPRIPPKWTCVDDIKLLFPISKKEEVLADEEAVKAIENIKQKKEAIEALEVEIEKDKANVCDKLREASKLVDANGKTLVNWYTMKRKIFDIEAFKVSFGEVNIEPFFKETTSRAFKVY